MKKIIALVLAFCTGLSMVGCRGKKEKRQTATFFDYFDTVVTVLCYNDDDRDFRRMKEFIDSEYDRYNKLYDIYNSYPGVNNIKTINDRAGKDPVKVDREIIDLLLFSKEWYEKSGGKLNIAMGSVLDLWHDARVSRESGDPYLPSEERLSRRREHMDIDDIVIDRDNMTVYIRDPLLKIDVGAVAKGYATEKICREAGEKWGNFAINAGGNVRVCGGPKNGNRRWGVGIQSPIVNENFQVEDRNTDMAYLNGNTALVCSGGYERYFVFEGKRYHHLINPDTLYPSDIYRGVDIICSDSGVADALSTALFMIEPDRAIKLIENVDEAECLLVMQDGEVIKSSGADKYLESGGITNKTK